MNKVSKIKIIEIIFFTKGENKQLHIPFSTISPAKPEKKKKTRNRFGGGLPFGFFEIILTNFDKVIAN